MFTIEYTLQRRGIYEQNDFGTVLKAAGETETKKENIQLWLQLDEGKNGFHLLAGEAISAVISFIFNSTVYNIIFSICFLSFSSFLSGLCLASLTRITSVGMDQLFTVT
jgi:hypothetical protein